MLRGELCGFIHEPDECVNVFQNTLSIEIGFHQAALDGLVTAVAPCAIHSGSVGIDAELTECGLVGVDAITDVRLAAMAAVEMNMKAATAVDDGTGIYQSLDESRKEKVEIVFLDEKFSFPTHVAAAETFVVQNCPAGEIGQLVEEARA